MAGLNTAQIKEMASRYGQGISEGEAQGILSRFWDKNQWGADAGGVESYFRGRQGGGGGGGQQGPSAEEIMRRAAEERNRKYQEQAKVWNEFMNSPTFWDAILARQMAEQYFNPYYQTILEEFVNPLQTRIRQSQENETRLLGELTRQKEVGSQEQQSQIESELEKAQGGFAGAGVYGGGGARRSIARTKISGERSLQDFLDKVEAQKSGIAAEEGGKRELYQGDIAQKERDVARERTGAIEEDVAKQKTTATKQQAAKAYEAISGKFGEFLLNVPDWLQLA